MENANVEKVKKEPMTAKQKTIFGLKIVGNVVFYVIIILLFLFSLMNINAGGKGGIPNLFGTGYLSVQSDSMSKKGDLPSQYNDYDVKSFSSGDLLKVKMLNDKQKKELKVGDVITFWDTKLEEFNTHRIVYMSKDANGNMTSISLQGDFSVSVKGTVFDPTDSEHADVMLGLEQSGDIQTFSVDNMDNIKAKVTKVNYGAGKVMDNIQKNWLWYFVLPVLVLLLFEVFMVVKNFMDLKAEKNKATMATNKEAMLAEIASEKEKMRQELLAELKAQQEAMAKAPAYEDSEEKKPVMEQPKDFEIKAEEVKDLEVSSKEEKTE